MKGELNCKIGIGFVMHYVTTLERVLEIDSISQKIDLSDLYELR